MPRLFYPALFCLTAALLADLSTRQALPFHWLSGFGAQEARAQQAGADPRGTPQFNQSQSMTRSPRQALRVTEGPRRYPTATPAAPRQQPFRRQALPVRGARLRIPAPGVQPGAGAPDGREGGRAAPQERIPFENAKVIARIGSKEHILLGDVIGDVNKEFAQMAPKIDPREHEALKQMLIYKYVRQLIPMKVLFAEASTTIPDDKMPEVMKQIDGIFVNSVMPVLLKDNKLRSPEELDAKLKAEGSSLKQLKQTFAETQIVQQFIADHTEVDKEVSPDELLAHYRAHYEEYKYKAKVRWDQLLVKFNRKSKPEALAKLADMGNQVRNGAAWEAVAKARSEGYTAKDGGAHDWTTKGSLKFEALDHALFTLPIGHMSQLLIDEESAQIVRVVDRQPAGATSFEEAQGDIKKLIVEERVKAKKNEFIKSVLEDHRPAIWTIFDEQQAAAEAEQQKRSASTARRPTGRTPR